jgi:hypothetical protein
MGHVAGFRARLGKISLALHPSVAPLLGSRSLTLASRASRIDLDQDPAGTLATRTHRKPVVLGHPDPQVATVRSVFAGMLTGLARNRHWVPLFNKTKTRADWFQKNSVGVSRPSVRPPSEARLIAESGRI